MAKMYEHDKASNRPFGGRIRRYAKVTSTMGGLAARVAGERYLGWNIDREQHAAALREALGGLKGPIIENNDPSFTSKDIPSRAFTPPKFNPTSLNSITFFMTTNVSYVYSVLHP